MRRQAASFNFEPFINLVSAAACGSQIYKNEILAYKYAVDYYGDKRVALQKTTNPVENTVHYTKDDRVRDIMSRIKGRKMVVHSDTRINEITSLISGYKSIYSLFIYWPSVKVSNEKDLSVEIQDLFVRIPLNTVQGMVFPETEPFTLMRTTYTRAQWNFLYLHSHVRDVGDPRQFNHICLGSGPIRRTIGTLKRNPENEEALMLFFWELDKVVHVESIAGVPYKRLENIRQTNLEEVRGISDERRHHLRAYKNMMRGIGLREFLASFFRSEEIPFAFRDGKYILGCSFLQFALLLTNYYKKWLDAYKNAVNEGATRAYRDGYPMLEQETFYIKDNKLWISSGSMLNRRWPGPSRSFVFNDKTFHYTLIECAQEEEYTKCRLLNLGFTASVLNFVLTAVNMATSYSYEETTKEETDLWNEQLNSAISRADASNSGKYYAITAASTSACD